MLNEIKKWEFYSENKKEWFFFLLYNLLPDVWEIGIIEGFEKEWGKSLDMGSGCNFQTRTQDGGKDHRILPLFAYP